MAADTAMRRSADLPYQLSSGRIFPPPPHVACEVGPYEVAVSAEAAEYWNHCMGEVARQVYTSPEGVPRDVTESERVDDSPTLKHGLTANEPTVGFPSGSAEGSSPSSEKLDANQLPIGSSNHPNRFGKLLDRAATRFRKSIGRPGIQPKSSMKIIVNYGANTDETTGLPKAPKLREIPEDEKKDFVEVFSKRALERAGLDLTEFASAGDSDARLAALIRAAVDVQTSIEVSIQATKVSVYEMAKQYEMVKHNRATVETETPEVADNRFQGQLIVFLNRRLGEFLEMREKRLRTVAVEGLSDFYGQSEAAKDDPAYRLANAISPGIAVNEHLVDAARLKGKSSAP